MKYCTNKKIILVNLSEVIVPIYTLVPVTNTEYAFILLASNVSKGFLQGFENK